MMPSDVGERAEAAILAGLVCAGKEVLVPFGAHRRYDLAYEEDGQLVRVQCKAGRERNGAIVFRTYSTGRNGAKDYRQDVDMFAVYCHDRREVYLVPVDAVPQRGAHLRLHRPRNGQRSGLRWAAAYLLSPGPTEDEAF